MTSAQICRLRSTTQQVKALQHSGPGAVIKVRFHKPLSRKRTPRCGARWWRAPGLTPWRAGHIPAGGPGSLRTVSGVIAVAEYDPAWPQRFDQLRREYARAMAAAGVSVVAIEHVGGTAVPGLAAKPVIDWDIVVAEMDVPVASAVLATLGFTALGELGIPLRWAFKEPRRLAGTNTYVAAAGSLALRNHLAVRDILRADSGPRERYAAVKRRVGATAANIDDYGRERDSQIAMHRICRRQGGDLVVPPTAESGTRARAAFCGRGPIACSGAFQRCGRVRPSGRPSWR